MSTWLNPSGFIVVEACEDYEQVLGLDVGKDKPPGGILTWSTSKAIRAIFTSRQAARQAIERTEHYRKAFGLTDLPEKKFCRIEVVADVEER
jgi:hypothetical protein